MFFADAKHKACLAQREASWAESASLATQRYGTTAAYKIEYQSKKHGWNRANPIFAPRKVMYHWLFGVLFIKNHMKTKE